MQRSLRKRKGWKPSQQPPPGEVDYDKDKDGNDKDYNENEDKDDDSILRILRTVLPALATMLPMQRDRMNCARKTMQETMAMSVPIPRTYMKEEMEEESFLKAIVKV